MEYEIRQHKFPNGTGQWEIWECIDGEWEQMYEETYTFIDEEDCANQLTHAQASLRYLEVNHV